MSKAHLLSISGQGKSPNAQIARKKHGLAKKRVALQKLTPRLGIHKCSIKTDTGNAASARITVDHALLEHCIRDFWSGHVRTHDLGYHKLKRISVHLLVPQTAAMPH